MTTLADDPNEITLPSNKPVNPEPHFHRNSFADFFAGGKPVWIKVIVGAIAMPIVLIVRVVSTDRARGVGFLSGPAATAGLLASGALVGAFLGASLAMKETIDARRAAEQPVSWPLRLAFCCGRLSLVVVWGPIGVAMLAVVSVLFL